MSGSADDATKSEDGCDRVRAFHSPLARKKIVNRLIAGTIADTAFRRRRFRQRRRR
jgi:hypothetical protein